MKHPKPHGLYRGESAEWKHEVVWVYYGCDTIRELHPRIYRARGYEPPFDSLPTTEHYRSMLTADGSSAGELKALA